jgi:hypothetical protein
MAVRAQPDRRRRELISRCVTVGAMDALRVIVLVALSIATAGSSGCMKEIRCAGEHGEEARLAGCYDRKPGPPGLAPTWSNEQVSQCAAAFGERARLQPLGWCGLHCEGGPAAAANGACAAGLTCYQDECRGFAKTRAGEPLACYVCPDKAPR